MSDDRFRIFLAVMVVIIILTTAVLDVFKPIEGSVFLEMLPHFVYWVILICLYYGRRLSH